MPYEGVDCGTEQDALKLCSKLANYNTSPRGCQVVARVDGERY